MGIASASTDRELDTLIDQYWDHLQNSDLADKSIEDYFYFAYAFVRWTRGEFIPGGMLAPDDSGG